MAGDAAGAIDDEAVRCRAGCARDRWDCTGGRGDGAPWGYTCPDEREAGSLGKARPPREDGGGSGGWDCWRSRHRALHFEIAPGRALHVHGT